MLRSNKSILLLLSIFVNNFLLFAEYDSTYILAVTQKYAIPENVQNGDYVDYWKKTYTWISVGAVSYTMEQNYRNAFTINSTTGLITISDASQINGKIFRQDTVINLLIRTTDSGVGFELDTAQIRVKENSYCKFIDYSYSGTENGTRTQPYNDIDDVTITPGFGYYIKRGIVFRQGGIGITSHIATANNPTIIGAYGNGNKPTFNGGGILAAAGCFFLGSYDDEVGGRVEHVDFYSLKIRNYAYYAFKLQRISGYVGWYNCIINNNTQLYTEASIVSSTSNFADSSAYRPHTMINCEFDTTWISNDQVSSHLKIGVGPVFISNCSFKNSAGSGIRITNGMYITIQHSIIDECAGVAGQSAIQIRADSTTIEDVRITHGGNQGIEITTNDYPRVPDNCKMRNCYISDASYGIRIGAGDATFRMMHGHIIENCLIKDGSVVGITVNNSTGLIIRRNEISNFTRDAGIEFTSLDHKISNAKIYYNILHSGACDLILNQGSGFEIYNNIVDGEIDLSNTTDETVVNNYFKSLLYAETAYNNIDIDTINTNLHFTNYTHHFYKLKNTAIGAIDKGIYQSLDYDFSGTPIQGIAPDIGAYEYINGADLSVPNDPSNLITLDYGSSHISFAWNDNSDNEYGFDIERAVGGQNFELLTSVSSNHTTFTDESVQLDIQYSYRIRAYNQNGYSDYSDTLSVFGQPTKAPAKPTDFRITDIQDNSVELAWSDNSDNENGFQLQRSDSNLVFAVIEYFDPDITFYTDSIDLQVSTYYYYRLRAYNEYGYSAFTDTIEAYTLTPSVDTITPSSIPLPPGALSASLSDQHSLLNWSDNSNNESAFIIKRAVFPSEDFTILLRVAKNTTSFFDTEVQQGSIYNYVVTSVNDYGESVSSNKARVSIPSVNELNRITDGQIVYYNFNNCSDSLIPDCSVYEDPLDLVIKDPNQVKNASTGILDVNSGAIIRSNELASKVTTACKQSNEITIECWLKTKRNIVDRPVKIITLENDSSQAFILGCYMDAQEGNKANYFINLTTAGTSINGKPDFAIDSPFDTDILLHIVYTREKTGTERLYINGVMSKEGFRPQGFDNWSDNYSLLLANDLQEDSPWTGDLYLCSIYNKALSESQVWGNYLASPFSSPEFIINSGDYVIDVFPNPANSMLNISIQNANQNSDISESYFIRLVNTSGIIVSEMNITDKLNTDPLQLPISSVKSGVYSLVLFNQHGIIDVKKVIICH